MIRTTVTGETMIFKNDKGFYSTTISKRIKNEDGSTTWENEFVNLNFTKKVDLPNRTKINITNGWWSYDKYTDKTGTKRIAFKIVVTDFTVVGENASQPKSQPVEFQQNDDDLPF